MNITFTENLPNRATLEIVSLPAGEFLMGSPNSDFNDPDDFDAQSEEKPQHQVKVNSFAIGKYPVTRSQYDAVMKPNPVKLREDNCPKLVQKVSWNEAQAFCQKLSQLTGKNYRLPTEAEWEYACRAGTTTDYYFGNDENQLGDYAWYNDDYNPFVGQKKPNAWGLYDMIGNVWQWCEDTWHNSYNDAPTDGSAWIENGEFNCRVLRGGRSGTWYDDSDCCRSAFRYYCEQNDRGDSLSGSGNGFRVVCDN